MPYAQQQSKHNFSLLYNYSLSDASLGGCFVLSGVGEVICFLEVAVISVMFCGHVSSLQSTRLGEMLKVTAKKNKTKLGVEESSCSSSKSSRTSRTSKTSRTGKSGNSSNSQLSFILSCYFIFVTISLLLYLCYFIFVPLLFCLHLSCLFLPVSIPCSRSSLILSSFILSPPPVPCSRSSVILSPFTLSPPLCPSVTLSPFTLSLLGYSVYRIVLTIRKGGKRYDNSVYYC